MCHSVKGLSKRPCSQEQEEELLASCVDGVDRGCGDRGLDESIFLNNRELGNVVVFCVTCVLVNSANLS